MKKSAKFLMVFTVIYCLLTSNIALAQWKVYNHVTPPATGATVIDKEDNKALYISRAVVNGAVTPGKIRSDWWAASIPFGGAEVWKTPYELYTGPVNLIARPTDANIPAKAVEGGKDIDGKILYIAIVKYNNIKIPGKYKIGWTKAAFAYGGKEIFSADFQMLAKDATPQNPTVNVVNRNETINGIVVKLYINANMKITDIKGILLMGSGNNENDPYPGDLNGDLENKLCAKLALENWVCAVVQYKDQPALSSTTWNANSRMLVNDFSTVATGIVAKYGGSRNKTVMGGISYTSFVAMGEAKLPDTPIKDFAGLLAACGASGTWESAKYYLPVANIVCAGNNEGDVSGTAFNTDIKAKGNTQRIKDLSTGVTDNSCSSHCGGNWLDFMYTNAKKFNN